MKNDIIGANHEFHDMEFAREWADRFVPTPERLELFDIVLSELLELIPDRGRVLELGIGPGYLASHVLETMPAIDYCGIDFSRPMLQIARARLDRYSPRVAYVQADLVQDDWESMIGPPVSAIVSTWALHDLGGDRQVREVYEKSARALGNGGVLLNGDFVKPDKAKHEFEPGRFHIARHLEMLVEAGFSDSRCLAVLEEEIESPTAAQNYACFRAIK